MKFIVAVKYKHNNNQTSWNLMNHFSSNAVEN